MYTQKNKQKLNAIIFDNLLSANNEFLFDCLDHKEYLSKNSIILFNELDLQKAIDVSLDSLCDIFTFTDNFNICKIYGDSEHSYQVARMIFSLKGITDELCMSTIFEQKIGTCIRFLSYSSFSKDDKKEEFKSNFIKIMIKDSISNNDLWFIRLLRDSEFYERFSFDESIPYLFFISIYFYYIVCIDKTVPNSLKKDIFSFFEERSCGLNSDGSSFYDIIKNHIENYSFDSLICLLPKLLKIYGEKEQFEPWYCPQTRNSWSSDEGVFDKSLLIRCWLEIVLYNYNSFSFSEEKLNEVINILSNDNRNIFAYELSKNWFSNNKFLGIDKSKSYLTLYKVRGINEYCDCNEKLIKYLFKIKNSINLNGIKKELTTEHKVDLELIKKELIDGFNAKKQKIEIYKNDFLITSKKEYYFRLSLEKCNYQNLIDAYINSLDGSFKNIIHDEFLKKINPVVLTNAEEKMKYIGTHYEYRSNMIYNLYHLGCSEATIKKISELNKPNLWLPKLTFWKEGAIKFNAECDVEKTFVRKLNSNEINSIIDEKYKVTDGLYKFNNGDDNKSVFVDRNQIYEMVVDKYIYACIVFKYEVHFDSRKIKYYILKENSNNSNTVE